MSWLKCKDFHFHLIVQKLVNFGFGLRTKLLAENLERFRKGLVVKLVKPVPVQRVAFAQRIPEHARWLYSCRTVMQVEQTLLSYHQSARDQQPWFHWREADWPRPIGAYARWRSATPACTTHPRPNAPCPPSPIPHRSQCCAWESADKTKPICLGTCNTTK